MFVCVGFMRCFKSLFLLAVFCLLNGALFGSWSYIERASLNQASQGFLGQLGVDGFGRALLVWREGENKIIGNTFSNFVWSKPKTLFTDANGIRHVSVSKSLCGDKTFLNYVTEKNQLKAAVLEDGSWSSSEMLLSNISDPLHCLAVTVDGTAMSLGVVSGGSVWSTFFEGTSWEQAKFVGKCMQSDWVFSDQSISVGEYPLRQKKIYAVWPSDTGFDFGVFDEETKKWSIESNDASVLPQSTSVVANGLGQVFLTWFDKDNHCMYGRYFDGENWFDDVIASDLDCDVQCFDIGMDESGVAYVIVSTCEDAAFGKIVAFVRDLDSNWTKTQLDKCARLKSSSGSALAVHPNGTALVVWAAKPREVSNYCHLYYAEYTPKFGWSRKVRFVDFSIDSSFVVSMPQVAVSRNGAAVVVWHDLEDHGDQHVLAMIDSEFTTPATPVPPQRLTGTKFKNRQLLLNK